MKLITIFIWAVLMGLGALQTGSANTPSGHEVDGGLSPMLVEIPEGPFIMGDSIGTGEHRFFLNGFEIDEFEVTHREFKQQFPSHSYNESAGNHPVTQVDWYRAVQYCFRVGKRLPTSAEWEKAARGQAGWVYPWGNKRVKKTGHPHYSGVVKKSVGSNRKDVSPYGVHDMAGSVWEWTSDGDEQGSDKIIRGGLWNLHLDFEYSKTYEKTFIPPMETFTFLGFRCARSMAVTEDSSSPGY
ncbi:MAG: hypothetical protein E2O44_00250 [Nitrospina sp.]|nr:MAG: hypothetical protein E2O44_00250 [Nitrospina sp.]